jgi:hypothetical protein
MQVSAEVHVDPGLLFKCFAMVESDIESDSDVPSP